MIAVLFALLASIGAASFNSLHPVSLMKYALSDVIKESLT